MSQNWWKNLYKNEKYWISCNLYSVNLRKTPHKNISIFFQKSVLNGPLTLALKDCRGKIWFGLVIPLWSYSSIFRGLGLRKNSTKNFKLK